MIAVDTPAKGKMLEILLRPHESLAGGPPLTLYGETPDTVRKEYMRAWNDEGPSRDARASVLEEDKKSSLRSMAEQRRVRVVLLGSWVHVRSRTVTVADNVLRKLWRVTRS